MAYSIMRHCGVGVFLSCEDLRGRFNESFHACAFAYLFIYLFIVGGDQLTCTTSTLYVEISPQWVSDLRRLWTSVP